MNLIFQYSAGQRERAMSQYGPGPSGFTMPTLADIVQGMQQQIRSSVDDTLDLSASSPDGKMLLIVAGQLLQAWQNLQVAYSQFNRAEVEGAGLDSLGDFLWASRARERATRASSAT